MGFSVSSMIQGVSRAYAACLRHAESICADHADDAAAALSSYGMLLCGWASEIMAKLLIRQSSNATVITSFFIVWLGPNMVLFSGDSVTQEGQAGPYILSGHAPADSCLLGASGCRPQRSPASAAWPHLCHTATQRPLNSVTTLLLNLCWADVAMCFSGSCKC